ncbi:hypothetical protein ABIA33_002023 [Streptacidiphilus sp. MAP12-16]
MLRGTGPTAIGFTLADPFQVPEGLDPAQWRGSHDRAGVERE